MPTFVYNIYEVNGFIEERQLLGLHDIDTNFE